MILPGQRKIQKCNSIQAYVGFTVLIDGNIVNDSGVLSINILNILPLILKKNDLWKRKIQNRI